MVDTNVKEPLLVVISGPSGVGKDSVVLAMKDRGMPIHFVVTATSRAPREGEVHGVDYHFFTKDEFEEMIEQDELLEYALVYSDYKGIPKAHVRAALASGRDVVMRLDVQGAATIRKLCPEALLIFLMADSEDELIDRLRKRKTESEDELNLRMVTAREELERVIEFDYIVPNRDNQLEKAVDSIEAIIHAEHQRVKHRKVTL